MATAAQGALCLDQPGRLLGVATGTRHFASVRLMGRRPVEGFLTMTERTGFDCLRQGMVAKRRHGQKTCTIGRMARVVVALDTGRCLSLGFNPMGDQHLGIGLHHGILPGHFLFLHTLLDGDIIFAGHEHPDNSGWDHLAAFMKRHDREMPLYRNN